MYDKKFRNHTGSNMSNNERESVFHPDSGLNRILNKVGNMIILSIFWLIGCIPIVTIGTSTIALYYTTAKVVRKEQGYVTKEFFESYKKNLKNGMLMTLFFLVVGAVLVLDRKAMAQSQSQAASILTMIYTLITLIVIGLFLYIFPVMSRFTFGKLEAFKLAIIMVFRHLPITVVLLLLTIVGIFVIGMVPIPMIFIIPGVFCYAGSFLMEKVLRKYMAEPETEEDKEKWYYM